MSKKLPSNLFDEGYSLTKNMVEDFGTIMDFIIAHQQQALEGSDYNNPQACAVQVAKLSAMRHLASKCREALLVIASRPGR